MCTGMALASPGFKQTRYTTNYLYIDDAWGRATPADV